MTDFNIHGSQLAKYIIDNKLQQNAGLHSEFYRLFPDHTSKHVMISLLQRRSEVSTKSSVHNFLIDHRLNPDKQSQALRVGLSCGKKKQKIKNCFNFISRRHIHSASAIDIYPASAINIYFCIYFYCPV